MPAPNVPSNQAVLWDGTRFGLLPRLSEETLLLDSYRHRAVSELLEALADVDRFVAAHVLLTKLAGIEYEMSPTWNGLKVDLRADESVLIDPAQRLDLARRWKQCHEAVPRSPRLPQ
jgi:hypothetical protein